MLTPGALGAGVLAGLAIALPLGAIGVLILREGVERGLRPALAAATAVATVDFAYATLAVLLGARVSQVLAGWERTIQLVGALVLAVVALTGARGVLRAARGARIAGGPQASDDMTPELPTAHVFARFVALTAVNPLTAVYFVALTAGLGDRIVGGGAGLAFVVGVFLGSWAWQCVLALAGGLAGGRLSPRLRLGASLLGYGIVALYALRLALG